MSNTDKQPTKANESKINKKKEEERIKIEEERRQDEERRKRENDITWSIINSNQ